jgi:S-formylglutathione hydrolase FrmB
MGRKLRNRSWGVVALLTVGQLVPAMTTRAAVPAPPCSSDAAVPDARVHRHVVDGVKVNVLVPPDYSASGVTYPVLYLLNGASGNADTWLAHTDLLTFTASMTGDRGVVIVLPDGGPDPEWVDFRDGSYPAETKFVNEIIPFVDTTYRVIADGAHRAIAGLSAGGFGALTLAGRHPDLFAAAGSMSGTIDITGNTAGRPSPVAIASEAVIVAAAFALAACASNTDPFPAFGNPITDELAWHEYNPPDLASNYGSVDVQFFVGTGIPCDVDDALTLPATGAVYPLEPYIRTMNTNFDAALTDAGVRHSYVLAPCGVHNYPAFERGLHNFWPAMTAAFGHAAPTAFDFVSAQPSFAIYGWSFTTDAQRAREFIRVTNASRDGIGLTGSGLTAVTTPGWFDANEAVHVVTADTDVVVKADSCGRLSFTVDLGPPHTFQQFTPVANAQAALGGYFTSRAIRFIRS